MQELWRQRRYRYIENVIDGLPSASHLGEAWAMDVEMASPSPASGKWRPSPRHFDEKMQVLVTIANGIEKLIGLQAEKYTPDLILPPYTAVDILRATEERRANETAMRIAQTLIPGA